MRIIDILNKIANGEEPPKKIVFENEVYEYYDGDGDYRNNNYEALFDYHEITDILNEEVQILETTITYKPNKINKIDYSFGLKWINCNINKEARDEIDDEINFLHSKINEIIEVLNNLK